MYAHELFENKKPNVVVTYPGRFQPFHKGHAAVFEKLQKQFGRDNVFILTSNDQSSDKNPFNFTDKYQLITTTGVPGHQIVECNKMYSLPEQFDPHRTIFITAVGEPDADRLNPGSFLKRDRKDKNGNVIKKAGEPGYYKKWGEPEDTVTADQHGYVIVIPEARKTLTINEEEHDASHGTNCRDLWNRVRDDKPARTEFLKQLYGHAGQELVEIFNKIKREDVQPDSNSTISPLHGWPMSEARIINPDTKVDVYYKPSRYAIAAQLVARQVPNNKVDNIIRTLSAKHQVKPEDFEWKPSVVGEDAAGVGVVAKNKKMAKDPRYSMSITKDVKPETPKNMLRAFRLTEEHNGDQDFMEMMSRFLPLAMQVLNITKLPKIKMSKHLEAEGGQPTFGRFVNDEVVIYLAIADRHPNDILRTLAHELVHFKQFLDHKLNQYSGTTGSPEENEAHAIAGVIMRHYNKKYPDTISSTPIDI